MNGGGPSTGEVLPMIASPSYFTMPKPVNMPFVMSWKNTMIAYETQKTLRVTNLVRRIPRSRMSMRMTATTPSCV
jgi:hypothetical protein